MNGSDVKIPPWVFVIVPIMASLVFFGIRVGGTVKDMQQIDEDNSYRLCRIEAALEIPQWRTCFNRRELSQLIPSGETNEQAQDLQAIAGEPGTVQHNVAGF